MTKGLPSLDVPFHLQEPNSCKKCTYSFFDASDRGQRYMRCDRSEYDQQCCYERHETGECGPAAIHWKERVSR